ncbi:hypothetical protein ZIOFF_053058 [Zingiber officinale]|uniref:T-complex protein 1 subunit gamma n=1 Tax=Zingiber officinale TaxID=94328 RepID=A0A8J5FBW4_ZINOF|nr:hypothetical protein ZIOFF_053058 [Zingiber officinale]
MDPLSLFLSIGLNQRTAENALVNRKVTASLTAVIKEVATKCPANALIHRPTLVRYIVSSKIKNQVQLDAALAFLSSIEPETFKLNEFEEACGVGVDISSEEIESSVNAVVEENMNSILEQRHRINVGNLCGQVRKHHLWADARIVKELIDQKLRVILGEKTAEDDKEPLKKKEQPVKVEEKASDAIACAPSVEEEVNPFLIFPEPAENFKVHTQIFFSNGDIWRAYNTKENLERHLKFTGGKVFTRFPPEPNGYLHIGHAKALFIDFGLAKDRGGSCYLRFDDTNPEAEKKEYMDHNQEIIQWMGWQPFKVTHTSDYFQELYDLAVELIRRGLAYVDHQTPEEVKEYREKKMNSPWRDRPIAESLKLFKDMKRGLIEEGKATLRLKQDMQSHNKNMYDLIAYRIKFVHHPQVGDKWCIYPSYDYSHCIVDSLENVTHSLCSLEFGIRRPSYYWLLVALGLYQPYVWEYSRLNVTNTVMSKRKLKRLVTEKWVDGWDDPRLMTLAGLRRRGVSSTAINSFIRGTGITRSDNSMIRVDRLEYHIREELNKTAPRTLVVLHPLKVMITNLHPDSVIDLDAKMWPDAPSNDSSSYYKVPFTNVIYIEQSDFRLKDSKDFYGLAPGKTCTEVILGDNGTVLEIHAEYDPSKKTKPKGVLHWVAQPSPGIEPLKMEVRLFEKLFLSEDPAKLEDWLADLNPHSKELIPEAYAVPSLANAVLGDKFQFERLGYFAVDLNSSSPDKLIVGVSDLVFLFLGTRLAVISFMFVFEAKVLFLVEDSLKRESGTKVHHANIQASKAVADIIRTTLGPRSMLNMLLDAAGGIVVTNHGNAILRELDLAHPAAKSMIELSRTQDDEVGDGTTSVIVLGVSCDLSYLAREMLHVAATFIDKNYHPTVICRAYNKALEDSIAVLDKLAMPIDVTDRKYYTASDIFALQNKLMFVTIGAAMLDLVKSYEQRTFVVNDLAIDATTTVGVDLGQGVREVDIKKYIKVEKVPGGQLEDSRVLKGVMINKDVVALAPGKMRSKILNPRIILLDCSLEYKKGENQTNAELINEDDWEVLLKMEEEYIQNMCMQLLKFKPDLVITEKGLSDLACHYLSKAGVSAIRRLRKTDNNRIDKACGGVVVNRPEELQESDVGTGAGLGASKDLLNEVERNLQWLYEAAAIAFEAIPRTLAQNCGVNVIRTMTALQGKHASVGNEWVGIDGNTGEIVNMKERKIYNVKAQTFKTAIEAACMLLRIDDIVSGIKKKQAPGPSGALTMVSWCSVAFTR